MLQADANGHGRTAFALGVERGFENIANCGRARRLRLRARRDPSIEFCELIGLESDADERSDARWRGASFFLC